MASGIPASGLYMPAAYGKLINMVPLHFACTINLLFLKNMLVRLFIIFLALLLPGTALSADRTVKRKPVLTEARTALVIGNSAYTNAPLANPVHDAEDMAAALRKAGFQVDLRLNSNRRQMKKAIRALGDKLRHGGVGLFYFAGHGIQVNGINYLVPVGADIQRETEVEFEAVDANRVLAQMQDAGNRLNMVFLDACRNNPYERSFRSARNGLAAMDAPRGSLVSFATAPGKVAADGTGRNGIYTKHLLKQMAKNGLEIGRMMRQVRRGVQEDTNNTQTPFELSSLIGDFYFLHDNKGDNGGGSGSSGEEDMWSLVKNTANPGELRLFLEEYPDSRHRGVARIRLARLEQANAKPEPAPEPEPVISKGRLYVNTVPDDATIRILNIKPRYRRGMQLPAGSYHVEVTRAGYSGNRQWVELSAGEDVRLAINLEKIPNEQPAAVAAPVSRPTSRVQEIRREGRFIAYSNGTVKDSKTGLIWAAKNSPESVTWQQAKQYCENYTGGGYSDWRMPTQDELSALYDAGIREVDTKGNHIIDIYYWVWAADTRGFLAARVGFGSGFRRWVSQSGSCGIRALPVRGGR